jgi:hypothetical protein
MPGAVEYKDFYASCDDMEGADHVFRTGGTLVFPTSGWSARIGPHRQHGTGPINPRLLELDLTVTEPGDGDEVLDVITPLELKEYRIEDPAIEYQQVHFHLVGRDDEEGPGTIEVVHTQ